MKKGMRNFWIGTGSVTTGATIAAFLYRESIEKLMGIALDRKEPASRRKGKVRLTGSKSGGEAAITGTNTSEELQNCGCEKVSILSCDGIILIFHKK